MAQGDCTNACIRYQRLQASGNYLIETAAGAGQVGPFRLSVTRPRPPAVPGSLAQLRTDSVTPVPLGASTDQAGIVLRGVLSDPDARDTLRLEVEVKPSGAPFDAGVVPDRESYQPLVDRVTELKDILGSNEENLRVAYFMGRLEYLGLGGWTAEEAARRDALRQPANVLGGAALLVDQHGFFRVDYGRVVLGRGGNLQLQLGTVDTGWIEPRTLAPLSEDYRPRVLVRLDLGQLPFRTLLAWLEHLAETLLGFCSQTNADHPCPP